MDEYRPGHASPADRVERAIHGHVVVHDDLLHADSLVARHVGGHLEVHDIAGIILDDQKDAFFSGDCLYGFIDLIRRRRRKDRPRHRGIQHALPDITCVSGLVPAASAGNQGDLSFLFRRADQHVRPFDAFQILRPCLADPLDHLLFDLIRRIDQLFHAFPSFAFSLLLE